jgi:Bacterial Ig-like domain
VNCCRHVLGNQDCGNLCSATTPRPTSTYTPTAHYVTQVSPQDGATGRPRNTNVKVTFSEPMDPTTINGDTFKLRMSYYQSSRYYEGVTLVTQLVSATVNKDPTDTSGSTYVLDPYGSSTGPLRADTQFEVELTTG